MENDGERIRQPREFWRSPVHINERWPITAELIEKHTGLSEEQ